jgi:excisionase family DNA binding protein
MIDRAICLAGVRQPAAIRAVRFERFLYAGAMSGAIAQETAQHLRAALEEVLRTSPDVSATALAAFGHLVDVLETSADAVVFAADATVSTQQAAALLGVSRMTVVRLVDRGELTSEGGAVHRRISVSELARYQAESSRRRRSAVAELAEEIDEDTPPDEVIETR